MDDSENDDLAAAPDWLLDLSLPADVSIEGDRLVEMRARIEHLVASANALEVSVGVLRSFVHSEVERGVRSDQLAANIGTTKAFVERLAGDGPVLEIGNA